MENRKYKRIPFKAVARLQFDDHTWHTEVLDICLKGALVQKPNNWTNTKLPIGILYIHLSDEESQIVMSVHIAHQGPTHVGLTWDSINLDSMTHLRRLLEFNSTNPALLNREFDHLVIAQAPAR